MRHPVIVMLALPGMAQVKGADAKGADAKGADAKGADAGDILNTGSEQMCLQ
jgi:hypothetical protein